MKISIRQASSVKCKTARRTPLIVKKIKKTCDADEEIETGTVIFERGYKFFGQFTYNPTVTFDILLTITVVIESYLYVKYGILLKDPNAEGMLFFNFLNIFFVIVGRFVWDVARIKLRRFNYFNLFKQSPKEDNFTGLDAFLALVMFLIITFTQLIRFTNLNVSAIDQFLFYVFAAPAEEAFFRYFLTGGSIIIGALIIKNVMRRDVKRWEEVTLKAVVGLITGLIFGFAHAERYAGTDLLVIMLNGIEFSVFYAFVRRMDVVLLAHVALNVRAGISVFT